MASSPRGPRLVCRFTDNGKQTVTDANGGRYDVLESHYKWDCGLSVRDWRYVVRIANIDMDDWRHLILQLMHHQA